MPMRVGALAVAVAGWAAVRLAAGDPAVAFAVPPKPPSEAVARGLKFLADGQQPDGGWGQGGGWRTGGTGRVEGADVADPSDVGNTCLALLALARGGHTPTAGEYKGHARNGLRFVCDRVEQAAADDLYVTAVRDTQLQGKIGPFADTFLAALVLAELKGQAGDDDRRLAACLDKAVGKIARHQRDDGTFAANGGWAPVLSQGLANKALARAKLAGAAVRDDVLAKAARQSEASLKGAGAAAEVAVVDARGRVTPAGVTPAAPPVGLGFAGGVAGRGGGDAGVPLYRLSQGAGNLQDVLNGAKLDAAKAKDVLADVKASGDARAEAQRKLAAADKLEAAAGDARNQVAARAADPAFVAGFGSNGGEEFLSFWNISEMLVAAGGKPWDDWDARMQATLPKAQDKDGGWSGHHCITGRTFCTAAAVLVLLADRTPFPPELVRQKK